MDLRMLIEMLNLGHYKMQMNPLLKDKKTCE